MNSNHRNGKRSEMGTDTPRFEEFIARLYYSNAETALDGRRTTVYEFTNAHRHGIVTVDPTLMEALGAIREGDAYRCIVMNGSTIGDATLRLLAAASVKPTRRQAIALIPSGACPEPTLTPILLNVMNCVTTAALRNFLADIFCDASFAHAFMRQAAFHAGTPERPAGLLAAALECAIAVSHHQHATPVNRDLLITAALLQAVGFAWMLHDWQSVSPALRFPMSAVRCLRTTAPALWDALKMLWMAQDMFSETEFPPRHAPLVEQYRAALFNRDERFTISFACTYDDQ